MKTTIYCKPTSKVIHSFYLLIGTEEFFLFSQAYRKGVEDFYGRGVHIVESMNYSKAHKDSAVIRTMKKIPMYVRYVEKEYVIEILEQTKKRSSHNYRMRCA